MVINSKVYIFKAFKLGILSGKINSGKDTFKLAFLTEKYMFEENASNIKDILANYEIEEKIGGTVKNRSIATQTTYPTGGTILTVAEVKKGLIFDDVSYSKFQVSDLGYLFIYDSTSNIPVCVYQITDKDGEFDKKDIKGDASLKISWPEKGIIFCELAGKNSV